MSLYREFGYFPTESTPHDSEYVPYYRRSFEVMADYGLSMREPQDGPYVRRLWESLRFPEGRVYEDVSTTYQVLSSAETIVTIPDALVLHRTRPGSITQTRSLRNLRDWMTAMDQYVAFVREKTPEIYDVEQMNLIQEARLRSMIVHWSAIPFSEQKAAEDIRTEILAAGHRQLALSGRFRTRAAYFLIRFCPRLIPILMPVYRPIRLFIHRVTGR